MIYEPKCRGTSRYNEALRESFAYAIHGGVSRTMLEEALDRDERWVGMMVNFDHRLGGALRERIREEMGDG